MGASNMKKIEIVASDLHKYTIDISWLHSCHVQDITRESIADFLDDKGIVYIDFSIL
jgi:hypothetical protein